MPGVFSKSVGWIVATVKNVSKIANIGKRGVLFVCQDETGMRVVGSPAMTEKFKKCCNCNVCNAATTWEVAGKSDSADLATGKV